MKKNVSGTTPKLAFLGAGNMGGALIQGALRAGLVRPRQISVYDVDRAKLKALSKKWGVAASASSREAARGADYIFLCVKPQQMRDLAGEIREDVTKRQCLVSIAAGLSTQILESFFGNVPVVRVMPNTPALAGSGMTAVTRGRYASPRHQSFALRFFASVGKAVVLDEKHFDAVTAVSGSGPAYLFYLAEALQEAAARLGLPSAVAGLLARETLAGSGQMLKNGADPVLLRRQVTSPGGTTEAALRFLEAGGWKNTFVRAVRKAKDRSQELRRAAAAAAAHKP